MSTHFPTRVSWGPVFPSAVKHLIDFFGSSIRRTMTVVAFFWFFFYWVVPFRQKVQQKNLIVIQLLEDPKEETPLKRSNSTGVKMSSTSRHRVAPLASSARSGCCDGRVPAADEHRSLPVPVVQIAALESELMQLMKQNGIQVNNNNSNSNERLSSQQQHSPQRAAAPPRGRWGGGGPNRSHKWRSVSRRAKNQPLSTFNAH